MPGQSISAFVYLINKTQPQKKNRGKKAEKNGKVLSAEGGGKSGRGIGTYGQPKAKRNVV